MATKKPKTARKPPAKNGNRKASRGFTAEERSAMRERVREQQSDGGEGDVLAAIARMPEPDRALAEVDFVAPFFTCRPRVGPSTTVTQPESANMLKAITA